MFKWLLTVSAVIPVPDFKTFQFIVLHSGCHDILLNGLFMWKQNCLS